MSTNHYGRVVLLTMIYACFSLLAKAGAQPDNDQRLWYDKPATVWLEALPLGNSRMGAMVYGGTEIEEIQLNEETFWSGGPHNNNSKESLQHLTEVRSLIFDGKEKEAEDLINKTFVKGPHGMRFLTVGSVCMDFGHKEVKNYQRELDLQTATNTTSYIYNNVKYTRRAIASLADGVVLVNIKASKKGALNFTLSHKCQFPLTVKAEGKSLTATINGVDQEGIKAALTAQCRTDVKGDGTVKVDGETLKVEGATDVTLYISAATNFVNYKDVSGNASQKNQQFLSAAETMKFDQLLKRHLAEYQKQYGRVHLRLATADAQSAVANSQLPTDQRLDKFYGSTDMGMVSLLFNYGRYLLISSSQKGGQAANLQGMWNDKRDAPWDSKYTININAEMNYWPAEVCNIPETTEPLFSMIKDLSETGAETARVMYGCRGWMAHHNTDIWRISGVVDGAFWGMWPMGSAWLSQHLWEKYLYNGDLKYLEEVYPIMKSACDFYVDFLVEEPVNRWLVVSPSISPENTPAGRPSICAGATMDNQILFDLFSKTIKAGTLLKKDKELLATFQKTLDRMPPMQIGQHGQVQEWMEDLDNPDDKHRHVSHLYGLYPSNQISPFESPQLFDAARTTLIQRGDVSTGWSMGWKVNFWARLLDGNHARKLISDQLTLVDPAKGGFNGGGGTYPNFFDSHPPFQIDGNFGCTSGITEMLMQSHDGAIHLLPALPDDWKTGEINGLRTQGGFEVSFKWENGQVQKIEIKSTIGGNCRIRVPNKVKLVNGKGLNPAKGENPNSLFETAKVKKPIVSAKAKLNDLNLAPTQLYDLMTEAGKTYSFVIK